MTRNLFGIPRILSSFAMTFRAAPIESEYGESNGMLRTGAVDDTKRYVGRTKTVFVRTSRDRGGADQRPVTHSRSPERDSGGVPIAYMIYPVRPPKRRRCAPGCCVEVEAMADCARR